MVYRGMGLDTAGLQLIAELNGLPSNMLLYSYLRAQSLKTPDDSGRVQHLLQVSNPTVVEMFGATADGLATYEAIPRNLNSLGGHLGTGGSSVPHFFQSSVPDFDLPRAITYARTRAQARAKNGVRPWIVGGKKFFVRTKVFVFLDVFFPTTSTSLFLPPLLREERVYFLFFHHY